MPLFVAYYRRALPRFVRARDLVAAGELGTITGVSTRLSGPYHRDVVARRARRARPCPGACRPSTRAAGCCWTSAATRWTSSTSSAARSRRCAARPPTSRTPCAVEDTVALTFRTGGGALGTAQWLFAAAERADEIVISGERAELRLSTFGNEPVELRRGDGVDRFDLRTRPTSSSR